MWTCESGFVVTALLSGGCKSLDEPAAKTVADRKFEETRLMNSWAAEDWSPAGTAHHLDWDPPRYIFSYRNVAAGARHQVIL